MKKERTVIGLDLDNTFGDFTQSLQNFVAEQSQFSADQVAENLPEPDSYSMDNWSWAATRFEGFGDAFQAAEKTGVLYSTMSALAGAAQALRDIHSAGDVAIHVVTARHSSHAEETYAAFKMWGINDLVDQVTFTNEKHHYPADVFIDDSPGHLEAFHCRGIKAIAFHQLYNASSPATSRAQSWYHVPSALRSALEAH